VSSNGRDFDAMVATGPTPSAAPPWKVGTKLDDWWASRSHTTRSLIRWSAPVGVMVTAALTRLIGLAHPHEIVFDETYYVKDAWTTWNLGYEATWQNDPSASDEYWANKQLAAGNADVFTTTGSFAVHPPLGKWLIALGMALFGPASSFGWRFAVAIFGILLVGLVMLVAHRLTRSLLVASLAGGLLAIDGNGIVMSRVALLDVFLAFFALLAFYFVLLDRERTNRTGALWRPWLLAAGAALGAATAIKWSGLWFIAFFGIWTVVADLWGMGRHWPGTRVREIVRPLVNFLTIVPIALAVYLLAWTGWFATDGGYYRQWATEGDHAWTGFWSWVPLPLQSFIHHQGEVYRFHSELRADHPYKSPAWAWLLIARPTAMWYQASTGADDPACASQSCGALITDLPNPLIWYASIAALVWVIVMLVRRRGRDGALWAIVIGFSAAYVPWLLFPERPTYFFYSIAYQPYLVIALAIALKHVLGNPWDERSRRRSGILGVSAFLVLAVALSVYFWPVWTGMTVDAGFLASHYWSPSWA